MRAIFTNADAFLAERKTLTTGMTGQTVTLLFRRGWEGLSRTAVFSAGSVTKDVILSEENKVTITIPWEVLLTADVPLRLGVYGVDASETVTVPTVWCDLGIIQPGADPSGDESTDPTLPVWAQIQGVIGDLDELETEDKSSLVAAINEAAQSGGGGGGTGDHRQLTHRSDADQHPMNAITGLADALEDKYEKPSGGVPKADLAAAVQTSLGKADSALQSHQSLAAYRTAAAQDAIDATKQDVISDLNTIRSGAAAGATAVQPGDLDGYATETWVQGQGYLTSHQSLAAYQTKAITDAGGYFVSDTVEGALQEIGEDAATNWKEIWNNDSPTSTFGERTLTIGSTLSNYNLFVVFFRWSTSASWQHESWISVHGNFSESRATVSYESGSDWYSAYRTCDVDRSAGTIKFYNCQYNGSANSGYMIPIRIIGAKIKELA